MAEYVKRETLKGKIGAHTVQIPLVEKDRDMFFHNSGVNCEVTRAVMEVENEPAADVVPLVHGRWVQKDSRNPFSWRTCSECGYAVTAAQARVYKGCPKCLARMDGGGNE